MITVEEDPGVVAERVRRRDDIIRRIVRMTDADLMNGFIPAGFTDEEMQTPFLCKVIFHALFAERRRRGLQTREQERERARRELAGHVAMPDEVTWMPVISNLVAIAAAAA